MKLKDFFRKITPHSILNWNRNRKKKQRDNKLLHQKNTGNGITKEQLINDLKKIGITKGDLLLVHSSLSKIGYLVDGPKTFVDALIEVVGDTGTILMPTSPNAGFQLEFIKKNTSFDVANSPSKTGAITEYFRKLPQTKRSLHPTEPVSAFGNNADYFINEHFNQITPYNNKSPFYKVSEKNGKLLYIGVTLSTAGTNLHTLEDAVDFKFPVYCEELFEVDVIDETGKTHRVKTKVHNPEFSKKRKCDDLIPLFINYGAMQKVKIGEAETLLCDAKLFFDCMVKNYQEKGITMYTPKGS